MIELVTAEQILRRCLSLWLSFTVVTLARGTDLHTPVNTVNQG